MSIPELNDDVLDLIFQRLPLNDKSAVSKTCTNFRELVKDTKKIKVTNKQKDFYTLTNENHRFLISQDKATEEFLEQLANKIGDFTVYPVFSSKFNLIKTEENIYRVIDNLIMLNKLSNYINFTSDNDKIFIDIDVTNENLIENGIKIQENSITRNDDSFDINYDITREKFNLLIKEANYGEFLYFIIYNKNVIIIMKYTDDDYSNNINGFLEIRTKNIEKVEFVDLLNGRFALNYFREDKEIYKTFVFGGHNNAHFYENRYYYEDLETDYTGPKVGGIVDFIDKTIDNWNLSKIDILAYKFKDIKRMLKPSTNVEFL